MNIYILGAGSWGTAISVHLSQYGPSEVTLVCRRPEHLRSMQTNRENEAYLPGLTLPESLALTSLNEASLSHADVILFACPSRWLRSLCEQLKDAIPHHVPLVSLSKGLEEGSFLTPSELIASLFPNNPSGSLSGPSWAKEVALGYPTALVLALKGADIKPYLSALSTSRLRIYGSEDIRGVELGGCLKNVYSIAIGICEGLGLGDNARAALLTRSLWELIRIGTHLGGDPASLNGLSALGDLVATSFGNWSRNRSFGYAIGKGESMSDFLEKRTVEGHRSTKCFHQLCAQKKIEAPILTQIHAILYEGRAPQKALEALMNRELKQEF